MLNNNKKLMSSNVNIKGNESKQPTIKGGDELKQPTIKGGDELKQPTIKGGVIKSRYDPRDYHAESIFHAEKLAGSSNSPFINKTIPSELFLFDNDSGSNLSIAGNGVYDQGPTYKCVAYVGCTIREKQVYEEDNNNNNTAKRKVTFSKDYIYDWRANSSSQGMSGADLMHILVTHGCIEESDYKDYLELYNKISELERKRRELDLSNNSNNTLESRSLDSLIDQENEKLNQLIYRFKNESGDVYARVTTIDGLKESLTYNGLCLIILPFYGSQNTQFWLPPSSNTVDEMGHALTVAGFSDNQQSFFLRNTWGPKWNGSGHVWFPYRSLGISWEIWTVFPRGTEHLAYHKRRKIQFYAGSNGLMKPLDHSSGFNRVVDHSSGFNRVVDYNSKIGCGGIAGSNNLINNESMHQNINCGTSGCYCKDDSSKCCCKCVKCIYCGKGIKYDKNVKCSDCNRNIKCNDCGKNKYITCDCDNTPINNINKRKIERYKRDNKGNKISNKIDKNKDNREDKDREDKDREDNNRADKSKKEKREQGRENKIKCNNKQLSNKKQQIKFALKKFIQLL